MAKVNSMNTAFLDLPPSCIEYIPGHEDYLLIGTYSLDQQSESTKSEATSNSANHSAEPQKRSGSIILVQQKSKSLAIKETVPVNHGILDLHFSPTRKDIFCTANSVGTISFYQIKAGDTSEPHITHLSTISGFADDALVLAMSWSPTDPRVVGVSLSSGKIVRIHLSESYTAIQTFDINEGHELEAWTLSFSVFDPDVMYSGGDDSVFQTVRFVDEPMETTPTSVPHGAKDRKTHSAGVTAVLPLSSNIIVTGSYDDHVRVLQVTPLPWNGLAQRERTQVLAELNLGGGVWRLKLLKTSQTLGSDSNAVEYLILASCMHAGARIIGIRNSESSSDWSVEVLASFEEHQSMNYGCDAIVKDDSITVVSTSFYDKRVCLWTFNANET